LAHLNWPSTLDNCIVIKYKFLMMPKFVGVFDLPANKPAVSHLANNKFLKLTRRRLFAPNFSWNIITSWLPLIVCPRVDWPWAGLSANCLVTGGDILDWHTHCNNNIEKDYTIGAAPPLYLSYFYPLPIYIPIATSPNKSESNPRCSGLPMLMSPAKPLLPARLTESTEILVIHLVYVL